MHSLPAGSGLSSSAAIVCSSALAVLTTLGQHASQTVRLPRCQSEWLLKAAQQHRTATFVAI